MVEKCFAVMGGIAIAFLATMFLALVAFVVALLWSVHPAAGLGALAIIGVGGWFGWIDG
jgi:hypothetical protein